MLFPCDNIYVFFGPYLPFLDYGVNHSASFGLYLLCVIVLSLFAFVELIISDKKAKVNPYFQIYVIKHAYKKKYTNKHVNILTIKRSYENMINRAERSITEKKANAGLLDRHPPSCL